MSEQGCIACESPTAGALAETTAAMPAIAQVPGQGSSGQGPIAWLLDTSPFPQRWFCGTWTDTLGWAHIISDLGIWLAYMAIPAALLLLWIRRRSQPFGFLFFMFAAFILSCGFTHLIDAAIFWWPAYRLSGVVKAVTALISLTTVALLLPALPSLMSVTTRAKEADLLEAEVQRRIEAEAQLQVTVERLYAVKRAARAGYWTFAPQTQEARFGELWYTILGYKPFELPETYQTWLDLLHPEDRDRALTDVTRSMENGDGTYASRFRLRRADGGYTWIASQGQVTQRDEQGRPTLLLGVNMNIDHLYTVEHSLAERTKELDTMLYTLSHDMRSPIVTMRGFIGLAKTSMTEGQYEQAKDDLHQVDQAAHRLQQMVDGVLDISRAGRGRQFQRIAKPHMQLKNVLLTLESLRQQQQARIDMPETLPALYADPSGFERVMQNLISNALVHGCPRPGMAVQVLAESDEREVRLAVRDDGPGIEPQLHDRAFEMFERLGDNRQGVGIGLASVSRVMQRHHGRTWIESDGKQGTTVWVAFPHEPKA